MRKLGIFILLVGFLPLVFVQPGRSQTAVERFELGYSGVPLKYERVLDYHHPYPQKTQGILVQSASPADPTVRKGLRVGDIIVSVSDTPVNSVDAVRDIVIDNFGRSLSFELYKKTPRYKHRLRDDPFYEPERGVPYERVRINVTYDTPGQERNPVVAGPTNRLYHKRYLKHSPDTTTNTVYQNPRRAQDDNLEPCRVCFPSGAGGSLQNMLQEELVGGQEFSSSLTQGAPRLETVPEELQRLVNELSQYLVRDELEPSVALFGGNEMFAYGLPGGEILLTRDLFTYAEIQSQQEILIGHLLAHADQRHDHSPVQENQIRSLVERAIRETTGVDFEFRQLKEWSPAIPGFSYYNEVLEEGYGDPQEREAIFYAMLYRYRAGRKLNAAKEWIDRRRDMHDSLHPFWLDFTLSHPIPSYIDYDIERWKELIPKNFQRGPGSAKTTG